MITAKAAVLMLQAALIERYDNAVLQDIALTDNQFWLKASLPKDDGLWKVSIQLPTDDSVIASMIITCFIDMFNLGSSADALPDMWCNAIMSEIDKRHLSAKVGGELFFNAEPPSMMVYYTDPMKISPRSPWIKAELA